MLIKNEIMVSYVVQQKSQIKHKWIIWKWQYRLWDLYGSSGVVANEKVQDFSNNKNVGWRPNSIWKLMLV